MPENQNPCGIGGQFGGEDGSAGSDYQGSGGIVEAVTPERMPVRANERKSL